MALQLTTYCSICKDIGVPLIKYSKTKNKQYHMCRPCNAKRARKYHATPGGGENRRQCLYRSTKKHLHKQQARQKVYHAVKAGKIEKPENCSSCDEVPKKMEAHHTDYEKPLEVMWLCTGCHADQHRKERA